MSKRTTQIAWYLRTQKKPIMTRKMNEEGGLRRKANGKQYRHKENSFTSARQKKNKEIFKCRFLFILRLSHLMFYLSYPHLPLFLSLPLFYTKRWSNTFMCRVMSCLSLDYFSQRLKNSLLRKEHPLSLCSVSNRQRKRARENQSIIVLRNQGTWFWSSKQHKASVNWFQCIFTAVAIERSGSGGSFSLLLSCLLSWDKP